MIPNQTMAEAWNGPESVHYVDHADRYDRQLAPVTDALLAGAALGADDRVLDIGSGSGALALAAASTAARVVGVDISEPLTEVARGRARRGGLDNAEFLVADAQTYGFGETEFDVMISQFGLMFFDDPAAAFTNLHGALAADGRIAFTTWRCLGDNEWLAPVVDAVAEHVEVPDLGGLANGGGMFAMRDDAEVADLLESTGFSGVAVDARSPAVLLGGGGDVDECEAFLLGTGIVRGLMGRLDDDQRSVATRRIRAELEARHEVGAGVRLGVGVWLVTARA